MAKENPTRNDYDSDEYWYDADSDMLHSINDEGKCMDV